MLLTACKDDKNDTPSSSVAERTVLVYMMGENSLSKFIDVNINQMIKAGDSIPSNCHLLVYVDDADANNFPRIYEINSDGKKLIHQYDSEQNSASGENLSLIMKYATDNYPAKSYGLILWSHASAWCPAVSSSNKIRRKTAGIDNGNNSYSNSGSELEIADLATSLKAFPKLDFIFCDECFMQSVEVAYQLKDVTNYLVGSPAEIPGYGAPYDQIMKELFAQPADLAGLIARYNGYYKSLTKTYGVLLSVIKTDELEKLATLTGRFLPSFINNKNSIATDSLQQYCIFDAVSYWRPEYYDMKYTMHTFLSTQDYTEWDTQFEKAVPYKIATPQWYSDFMLYFSSQLRDETYYGGMSMFIPSAKYNGHNLNEAFQKTDWYTAAGWSATGW
jgi:hypothetical protein